MSILRPVRRRKTYRVMTRYGFAKFSVMALRIVRVASAEPESQGPEAAEGAQVEEEREALITIENLEILDTPKFTESLVNISEVKGGTAQRIYQAKLERFIGEVESIRLLNLDPEVSSLVDGRMVELREALTPLTSTIPSPPPVAPPATPKGMAGSALPSRPTAAPKRPAAPSREAVALAAAPSGGAPSAVGRQTPTGKVLPLQNLPQTLAVLREELKDIKATSNTEYAQGLIDLIRSLSSDSSAYQSALGDIRRDAGAHLNYLRSPGARTRSQE